MRARLDSLRWSFSRRECESRSDEEVFAMLLTYWLAKGAERGVRHVGKYAAREGR